jgi:hypothetical protein
VAERARIVLLAADGLAGLADAPRPGGPKTVLTDAAIAEILSATVTPAPDALQAAGVTHWSSRRLADWLRRKKKIAVSHDSVTRLWRRFCLQPHRTEGFKFSTDPQLEAKITDVVGLYLHPLGNAVVVCVDEKSQCQAQERSQPILPMRSGIPERQTHDYARHGVTCLFAALNTAVGQVTDACYPRHRHQEFLRFLKKVAAAYPGVDLHVLRQLRQRARVVVTLSGLIGRCDATLLVSPLPTVRSACASVAGPGRWR